MVNTRLLSVVNVMMTTKFKPTIIVEVLSDVIGEKINSFFDDRWVFYLLKNDNLIKLEKLKYFKEYPYYFNYLIIHKENISEIESLIR